MSKVYENRSLKIIVDEVVDLRETISTSKRLGRNVLHYQLNSTTNHLPLCEGFFCPIMLGLINIPVIDPEGYSYEKAAIENWIKSKGASPVTRRAMTMDELYPNKTLAMLMADEKNKSEDQIHPAFKQWSEEPLRSAPDVEIARWAVSAPAFHTTSDDSEATDPRRPISQCRRWGIVAVIVTLLGVLAWMVPVMSTVILVFVLLGIGSVAWCSSNNRDFERNGAQQQGARVSALPISSHPSPHQLAPSVVSTV